MLLHRLSDAIRQQNWFTVLIELTVVVLGLFIGLQVDGWNEYRKDRAQEQLYLERLLQEVTADRKVLTQTLEGVEAKQRALIQLREVAQNGALGDRSPESLLILISQSVTYGWSPPQARTITFDDLQGGGQMSLIRDAILRMEISKYYYLAAHSARRLEVRKTPYPKLIYQLVGAEANVSVRA